MSVESREHVLPVAALNYELPERLIATRPAEPRDSARLLVVHREEDRLEHRHVRDLPDYLHAGDGLVFNTSAVAPARLLGQRVDSGGRVEGLFLEEVSPRIWRLMLRSNGRLRTGQRIALLDRHGGESGCALELRARDGACWMARLEADGGTPEVLDRAGRTPLPPYILRARGARGDESVADDLDRAWYQTVYADPSKRESVAAPTAGLHFTPELLARLETSGVRRLEVILHVGAGTFKPIATETLQAHRMHAERFEIPASSLAALHETDRRRATGGSRLLPVGTTAVRALESLPEPLPGADAACRGETDLMIAPGYRFRYADGLMTNFHLPRSTLLALVGAMVGIDRLLAVYREAVRQEYRFYSYGDAMLILP